MLRIRRVKIRCHYGTPIESMFSNTWRFQIILFFFLSDMPPFLENPAAPWCCLCSHFASEVEQEQKPGGSGDNEATVVSVKVSHPPRKTGMIENVQALVHAR